MFECMTSAKLSYLFAYSVLLRSTSTDYRKKNLNNSVSLSLIWGRAELEQDSDNLHHNQTLTGKAQRISTLNSI